MTNFIKAFGIIILLLCLYTQGGVAFQLTGVSNPFGDIGARGSALGNSDISDPNDISIMYINPAALVHLLHYSVLVDFRHGIDPRSSSYTAAAPLYMNGRQGISLGATVTQWSGPENDTILSPHINGYELDAAFATTLTYALAVGVRLGTLYTVQDQAKSMLGFAAIGLYYEPIPTLTYSFVYNGFSHVFSTPADSTSQAVGGQELPRSFAVGLTMRFPFSTQNRLVTISFVNEKIVGVSGLNYKGGFEIYPLRFITLRAGLIITPETTEARYGIGFNYGHLQLNYALQPHEDRGPVHQVSLLIQP